MTPLLQQYFTIKERYPNTLLFFQVGDFYELFFEDAVKASAALGIVLTKRGTLDGKPIPLCGVPIHSVDYYLIKLVKGGFHVALCKQQEPARPGKVVARSVEQVLTPGTLTDTRLLHDRSASYCGVVFPLEELFGCAFIELLTGQIFVTILPQNDKIQLEAELRRYSPDELLLPRTPTGLGLEKQMRQMGFSVTIVPDFEPDETFATWAQSLTSSSLDLIQSMNAPLHALALLYSYLKHNQERALSVCTQLFFYAADDFLLLDAATQRNLELVKNSQDGSEDQTLFSILNRAATPMGARMIKKWLVRPLLKKELIEARHQAVGALYADFQLREALAAHLKECGDFERIVGRVVLRRASVGDYRTLGRSLTAVAEVKTVLGEKSNSSLLLRRCSENIGDFSALHDLLSRALSETNRELCRIKEGYNAELDRLKQLMTNGAQELALFERAERQKTGIQSLKIKYSRSQGYAIEVTKANREHVPLEYERLQTLANAERYTTPTLRALEQELIKAEHETEALENALFEEVCAFVDQYGVALKKSAQQLAQCDAFLGFARTAYEQRYCRPTMHEGRDIIISQGRHPVVAAHLGAEYVANDVTLTDNERTWIITGPNMGGKSTFLRQVALTVILAQSGSWVPAESATIPLIDRIFTRIGASDNVATGKSTFLVEMEETATICNGATERSLVVLDEVGRGTSTYDGLAIAQAVVEYLHEHIKPRALFATHFHELTALTESKAGIVSYHAASTKTADGIILLHKIIKGCAHGSFGIEVAKQVHLPQEILRRAEELALHYMPLDRPVTEKRAESLMQ